MRVMALAVGWVVAGLVGCGGDDDGGPPSPAEVAALCDDLCGACAPDNEDCGLECQNETDASCYSADALSTYVDCLVDTSCELDDAIDCTDRLSPSAAHERWGEECRDRLAECGRTSDEISNDCDLDEVVFYSSGWAEDARSCFDEDCAAIEACLDASLDSC